MIRCRRPKPM